MQPLLPDFVGGWLIRFDLADLSETVILRKSGPDLRAAHGNNSTID